MLKDKKSVKAVEFKKKTNKELTKLLIKNKEHLRSLRFDLASGRVKNVREIRHLKKDIARILTLIKLQEKKS